MLGTIYMAIGTVFRPRPPKTDSRPLKNDPREFPHVNNEKNKRFPTKAIMIPHVNNEKNNDSPM